MQKTATRSKHILVVQYSQSGQLSRVVENVCSPIHENDAVIVHELNIEPEQSYPFPWPFLRFFNVFPECVYLDPPQLKPFKLDPEQRFDLVILAYQVWFLSPSLPVTAFLQSETAKQLLKNTPVITLIGCRNMWTQAQHVVKQILARLGARLIDNAVLIDQGSTMASFITTPRWLLTGRKNSFLGLPPAGIAEHDIKQARRFGLAIVDGLNQNKEQTGEPLLSGLGAVQADVSLIQSEKIGYRSFRIWGRLLRLIGTQRSGTRKLVLVLYIIFLICLIVCVVPVVSLFKWLTRPILKQRHQQIKQQFELPSGSGIEKMEKYT